MYFFYFQGILFEIQHHYLSLLLPKLLNPLYHICQTQGPQADAGPLGLVMWPLHPVLQLEHGGTPFPQLRLSPSTQDFFCHLKTQKSSVFTRDSFALSGS